MKRVLLVIEGALEDAGVPNVVMHMVKGLSGQYRFDVLCRAARSGSFDREFTSYGGRVYRMNLPDYNVHPLLFLLRPLLLRRKLNALLRANSYDILHCHSGFEAGLIAQIGAAHRVPVRIAHAHGTYQARRKNPLLTAYNRWNRRLMERYCTAKLACSNVAGETLYGDRTFRNVLNPVDLCRYSNVEKVPHTGIHLLQIGYFSPVKNQLFSLQVVRELKRQGRDVTIAFVGYRRGEAYYLQMMQFISENALEEQVLFYPRNADKVRLLGWADLVLLPSSREGLPLVSLEAQAGKTKCLLSNRVPREADRGTAVFLAYNDLEQWVETIEAGGFSAAEDEQRLKEVGLPAFLEHVRRAYEGVR